MSRKREWFKHDAWFLADDKIRRLGHKFGAQGPLVAEALLELAKRQRMAGDIEVDWGHLAEHAFVKGTAAAQRRTVKQIIELCEQLEFVQVTSSDDDMVRLTLPKWRAIQGGGVPGSERTAAWRARKEHDESDESVTSQYRHGDGDVTSPHAGARAVAKESRSKGERAKALPASADRAGRELGKASDEDRANCRLFAELVRQRNPKAKVPDRGTAAHEGWYRQMRLLREADGNDPAEIADVIRWMFTDPHRDAEFWGTTVGAPSGLREHYPQIWAKMKAASNGHAVAGVETSEQYLARRGSR
jgi:hypothetical protein